MRFISNQLLRFLQEIARMLTPGIVRTGRQGAQAFRVVAFDNSQINYGLGLIVPLIEQLLIFGRSFFFFVKQKLQYPRAILPIRTQLLCKQLLGICQVGRGYSANLYRLIDLSKSVFL